MNGVAVGLGLMLLCLAVAVPLILQSRRLGLPWINPESGFGFVAVTCLFGATLGLVIAVVSFVAWVL